MSGNVAPFTKAVYGWAAAAQIDDGIVHLAAVIGAEKMHQRKQKLIQASEINPSWRLT